MFQYLNYVYKIPTQFDVDTDTRNYRYLELIHRQLSDTFREESVVNLQMIQPAGSYRLKQTIIILF